MLICTPGRILDHLINAQSVHLEMLEIVVFDEADRLLELGFREECQAVLKKCGRERQTMLFSATVSNEVKELASTVLNKPCVVNPSANVLACNLSQEFIALGNDEKREATLLALCCGWGELFGEEEGSTETPEKEKAVPEKTPSARRGNRKMIFFSTKKQAHRMGILFGLSGLSFAELHGDLAQKERSENIGKFQRGEVEFLLATDLAARGLDLPNVEAVINYEVPSEDAKYIHRVGRTARRIFFKSISVGRTAVCRRNLSIAIVRS